MAHNALLLYYCSALCAKKTMLSINIIHITTVTQQSNNMTLRCQLLFGKVFAMYNYDK